MNTLTTPIDLLSPGMAADSAQTARFDPVPHCTNPRCPFFHHDNPDDSSWRRDFGSYETKAFGTVPRYQCKLCGKTFSTQSFSLDYWVHKPVDYLPLIISLVSTSGQGNMSRFTSLRYEVIQNRCERLCRLFLSLHAHLRSLFTPEEPFALDGFESFSRSHYFPNNINLLVGADSEFIYGMSFSQLRRKGRMSEKQKLHREVLEARFGKARANEVEMGTASLINDLCTLLRSNKIETAVLRTDEHKAYPRALKRVEGSEELITHEQYSSRAPRGMHNPLFSVNYVDRQVRKDQANHVRESVQFARCPAAMMVRLTIYQIYHNYLMPRRVRAQRKGDWETRGELMGLKAETVLQCLKRVWGRRVFLNKSSLWEAERMTWLLEWRNSMIPMGRRVPLHVRV